MRNLARKDQQNDTAPLLDLHLQYLAITGLPNRLQGLIIKSFVAIPQINSQDTIRCQTGKNRAIEIGCEKSRGHGSRTKYVEEGDVVARGIGGIEKIDRILIDDAQGVRGGQLEIAVGQLNDLGLFFHHIDPSRGMVVQQKMRQSTTAPVSC